MDYIDWTQSDVVLSTSNVISDTVSLVHTTDFLGVPITERCFGLVIIRIKSQVCIDMSVSSIVNMTFDVDLQSYYSSLYLV